MRSLFLGKARSKAARIGKLKKDPDFNRNLALKQRNDNYEKYMLYQTRSSAKKRGLEFNLTIKDFVIPEFCPYLEIKLTRNIGLGKTPSNPSIDRIDNSFGYVNGNIQIISDAANSMKRNASIEGLLVFAKNILKMHS